MQLKEQSIQDLNDTEMLGDIIKELTKICGNEEITSKNVLSWAKRVEVQRAQSAIVNSLTEVKEFDKLKVVRSAHGDSHKRYMQTKIPTKQTCKYCGSSHSLRQCPAYGKKCTYCSKIGHFRAVCRSSRAQSVNKMEQEADQDNADENSIDSMNINSVHFNKNTQH